MVNYVQKKLALLCFVLLVSTAVAAQWNADKTVNNPVVVKPGVQDYSVSCSDGLGGAIIAWYDNVSAGGALYDVYLQHINSNGQQLWASGGISVGVQTSGIGDIDIVADGQGGAVVAFIVGSGSTLNIYAQRLNANGDKLWNSGNVVVVCNAANAQFAPQVVNAGDGSFVIAWQDERSGTSTDDIYAQKYNDAGDAQWTANGVVVNAALNNQENPQLISIGNGEVIATWDDFRNGTNYDLYAQKLNAAGVRQWRGLDNLLSGKIISTAAANQRFPKICTDGSAGAIISWQDFRNGATNSTDIYAQRIDSAGVVKWTANGVLLSATTDAQAIEDIAFTGDGAAVCWTSYPNSSEYTLYDVYAQKVDTNGIVKWTPNGVAVCNAADLQNSIKVAADGNNGAFFTWIDRRGGSIETNEIYAQQINSNGTAAWAQNGVVVCNNSNLTRSNPHLVASDCSAIFIWQDIRNSSTLPNSLADVDIYATAFDCNGEVIATSNDVSWTGAVSNNWATAANWSSNTVPTLNDNVIIPAGTAFSPVINNGITATCKTINLKKGASLTVISGGNLNVGN